MYHLIVAISVELPMSISPMSGVRELQRSVYLKSYNVQKWEIRFTLGLNAAKNTHYIKKKSQNKSCYSYKKVSRHTFFSSPGVELCCFSISVHYKISNVLMFRAPPPLMGEIDICSCGLLCTKFNSEQLFFKAFFDVIRIFGSTEPQSESNFLFLTL